MTPGADIFIQGYSVACALGGDSAAVAGNLFTASPRVIDGAAKLADGRTAAVGSMRSLDEGGDGGRTNRLVSQCFAGLAGLVGEARERFRAERMGVVMGTSTSGIGEGGDAIRYQLATGALPEGFNLAEQQLGDTSRHLAELCRARGPNYVVSTACTSGARALAAGARLLQAGLCDAVVCGGADSICELTVQGFASLEALSTTPCNPMSANRSGMSIGEGAALFLLSREPGPHRLAGWGESVDGHHMSAPDPTGAGAERAMRAAMQMAQTPPRDLDFVHLHGTATPLNDAMEANLIERVFGLDTPCASTKPLTGHTLGAAGAVQAALCLMAMERGRMPPHIWDGVRDPLLAHIRLASIGETASLRRVASASYAFGGNNTVLVLAST